MAGNFVKLFRSIERWQWYKNVNTKIVFLHLLIKAKWKPEYEKGVLCERGQWITTRADLANQLNLSEQQIRTAISNLISTKEITTQSTKNGTLITIENYEKYQDIPLNTNQTNNQPTTRTSTKEITSEQPGINQVSTNLHYIKNIKNNKNYKNTRNKEGTALEIALENNYGYIEYCLFADEKGEPRLELVDYVLMRDGVAE